MTHWWKSVGEKEGLSLLDLSTTREELSSYIGLPRDIGYLISGGRESIRSPETAKPYALEMRDLYPK